MRIIAIPFGAWLYAAGSAIAVAQGIQADTTQVRDLFRTDQPIAAPQLLRLLDASHVAVNGLKFRVTLLRNAGGRDIRFELQMGLSGGPRYQRFVNPWLSALDDFTGRAAPWRAAQC
jgi:hypothetical protein